MKVVNVENFHDEETVKNLVFTSRPVVNCFWAVIFLIDVKEFQLKKSKTKLATIRTVELLRDVKMWPPEL